MITEKTKSDGYFKISDGQAQIQLRKKGETIGVLHSLTVPDETTPPEFFIKETDIEWSLGITPCYLKVITSGSAIISYEDISG